MIITKGNFNKPHLYSIYENYYWCQRNWIWDLFWLCYLFYVWLHQHIVTLVVAGFEISIISILYYLYVRNTNSKKFRSKINNKIHFSHIYKNHKKYQSINFTGDDWSYTILTFISHKIKLIITSVLFLFIIVLFVKNTKQTINNPQKTIIKQRNCDI